jgi:hypothetical protein
MGWLRSYPPRLLLTCPSICNANALLHTISKVEKTLVPEKPVHP